MTLTLRWLLLMNPTNYEQDKLFSETTSSSDKCNFYLHIFFFKSMECKLGELCFLAPLLWWVFKLLFSWWQVWRAILSAMWSVSYLTLPGYPKALSLFLLNNTLVNLPVSRSFLTKLNLVTHILLKRLLPCYVQMLFLFYFLLIFPQLLRNTSM